MDLLENWTEEKRSAYLYRIIARVEKNKAHQALFLDLAIMADKQAEIWASQLKKANQSVPVAFHPDLRTRFVTRLVKFMGPRYLRFILSATKVRGMSIYRHDSINREFPEIFGGLEHKHIGIKSGSNIRAAIFGVNDGLLSNTSLILGVAGAKMDPHFILVSGIAGLLAGACSMGAGEYVSVRSQREMLEYQLELEKHELDTYPEEEAEELSRIYQARGIPKEEAEKIAHLLIQDPEKALETLAREELGFNPEDLASPLGAAVSSFLSFTIGAAIPLLPFVLGQSSFNLYYSIGLAGLSLFAIGALISLFTQRSSFLSGLRMLAIGISAGMLTYFIGTLFGVKV